MASIFGTLFERGLDPAKRSQLGAHYTDTATIERIIDPVLRRPLLQQWELVAQAIQGLMAKSKRKNDKSHQEAQRHFVGWLETLAAYRALDPACGSGNSAIELSMQELEKYSNSMKWIDVCK